MNLKNAQALLAYCLEAAGYAQELVAVVKAEGPVDWEKIDSRGAVLAQDIGSALETAIETLDKEN